MSEYFRAAIASGWRPAEHGVLRRQGLATVLKERAALDSTVSASQLPGEGEREQHRRLLAQRFKAMHDEEVELAASFHVRQQSRLAAEAAAAERTHRLEMLASAEEKAWVRAPAERPQSAAMLSSAALVAAKMRYGSSFLLEAEPCDETTAQLPSAAAAVEAVAQADADDVTPALLFEASGSACILRRHVVRPRSSLTRNALSETISQRLKRAEQLRPASAATVGRVL
jgi:hypothetical protein